MHPIMSKGQHPGRCPAAHARAQPDRVKAAACPQPHAVRTEGHQMQARAMLSAPQVRHMCPSGAEAENELQADERPYALAKPIVLLARQLWLASKPGSPHIT